MVVGVVFSISLLIDGVLHALLRESVVKSTIERNSSNVTFHDLLMDDVENFYIAHIVVLTFGVLCP